jgi:uncharacterized membrane protein YdbT with pleckstrin-like domain
LRSGFWFEYLNILATYCYWLCFCLSADRSVFHGDNVWLGKPYVLPAAVGRTLSVILFAILFVLLEFYAGVAFSLLLALPVSVWTLVLFVIVWAFSMLGLILLRASHTYILRQDALEIHTGIVRLHSFVVTPQGFGDLSVYQSIGGRIFGYGDLTINSQGERETKLRLVHSPFAVADKIRDVMGKPAVRVESHV